MLIFFVFKQKTAYEMRISDWSSDVCSSDLVERDLEDALFALFAQRAHQSTQLELLLVAEMKFLEYHDTARNQHAADFLSHSRRQQAVDIGADLGTDMVAQQRYLQSHGEAPLDVRRTAISIF